MANGRNWPLEIHGSEFEHFFRALRLPERPAEVVEAAEAWKSAKAELEAAQARHHDGGARLATQKLGEVPDITHHEVDELGAKIAPAKAAEETARAEHQRLVKQYVTNASADLDEPLQRYQEALEHKIAELESLLGLGSLLQTESAAARVTLPKKITSLCPHMGVHTGAMRAILQLANR